MNIYIIGDKVDTNLINLSNLRKKYPLSKFIISENKDIESNKEDLIIIMKELDDYKIKGKKALFLRESIDIKNNSFIIVSFTPIDVNLDKIKLLLTIFLD